MAYYAYYSLFEHNPVADCTIDCIVFIIGVAAIVSALSLSINKLLGDKGVITYIAVNLSVMLSIANVWFWDILSFPECVFITAIGVIMCFSAIIVFIKMQNIKGYILSAIFAILATGVYQQFLFVFTIYVVAICSVQVYKNDEITFKELFKRYSRAVVLILTSGVVYFIIGKVVQSVLGIEPNGRIASSISVIIENCIYYAVRQRSFINGRGYFKSQILTICFLIVALIWMISVFREWLSKRNFLKTTIVGFSFICGYISSYVLSLLSEYHSIRAMYPLFSVFALFTIGSLVLVKKNYIKIALSLALIMALVANIIVAVGCELNLKKQNDVDKFWSEQVISEIEKYENDGTKIEKIYYCYDSSVNIPKYTESAIGYTYSLRTMINYFSGRSFAVEEMSEEEKTKYFKDENWEEFNEEQIVFVGDTMYLCCY